ncbi:Bacterial alpha-L-rhamnosidase [Paenibacillus sp. LMG 31456]|uniref:alpha-L-rhamnosidase n=1 Tax=Paenibacillus foliorum TaxID=2654974 RepID=A0A972GLP6_9BACL|nr:alpha-L-rhamnosidase [Paenibacillus foliorum]NOU92330.1 Bacterial alpha-L-rhamnosidase [Paenibacillus foliorum]
MQDLKAKKLRCEYRNNPVGIDVLKPRLSWQMAASGRNVKQAAYQIQVSADNAGSFTGPLAWDSGKIISDHSVHVEYEGDPLQPSTKYSYRVRIWSTSDEESGWSETAYWITGLLSSAGWKAQWVTGMYGQSTGKSEPADLLRKAFDIKEEVKVKSAVVFVTALGLYELQLNGQRVGDWLLTPGWTSYSKRLQYQTYDVTSLLQAGDNAIGLMLADGWYRGNLAWKEQRNCFGEYRAGMMQLHIVYADGSEQTLATDDSWKASEGPIRMAELYHGETYDARMEANGWSASGYDDTDWRAVTIVDSTLDLLIAQENEPMRIVEEIRPVQVLYTPAGETVLDMGQNMVGWMRFTVKGEAGRTITLQHAEVLDKDGNFYIGNLRSAKQTITYTCKGEGTESYEPRFTFQGFQYVKVEGYPGEVLPEHFTGCVIHSDLEQTGSFECSHPLINQLQHNILWGQKGNFVDVPTDCPQRDERLGWTGDAQVFVRTSAFNMNVASFFTKWLKDLRADQFPDGGVPFVVPDVLSKDTHSSSAWGDAAVICPWTMYLCYGDTRILEEQYGSMKGWVEYIRSQGVNSLLWNTGFHFGDWLGLDAREDSYTGSTPKDLIASAFYYHSTRLLSLAADVLGNREDAEAYQSLSDNIKKQFCHEFITPAGRLIAPTQTAHVLVLMFGLVEGETHSRVIKTLVDLIEEQQFHLTTGFVGTPYLCHVLTENGYHDVALKLVLQESYPSWLFPVTKGATTMWEHWDGIKADGSFWSDNMNSFNHYAYGAIGDWLYQVVAGIDTDHKQAGYKHIHIRPKAGYGFDYVKAGYESIYGEIRSEWILAADGKMTVNITIPPNTSATVQLTDARLESLKEGEASVLAAEGIHVREQTAEGVTMLVGSGSYQFHYLQQ